MSHKDLVEIAYRWVLKRTSCGVAFRELRAAGCDEQPDVIGFASGGYSVLVEVKTSRSDYFADKKKPFRSNGCGMGRFRFYCCPQGLIKPVELPDHWGLIYINQSGKATCVHNPYNSTGGNIWSGGFDPDLQAERAILYSALRRLHLQGYVETICN